MNYQTSKFVDDSTYNQIEKEEITKNNIFIGNTFFKSEEFKIKYRQALIIMLFQKFKGFVDNSFNLHAPPLESREACSDYLSLSDDIFDWFSNTYEKTDDGVSFLYFSDVFEMFTSSNYYQNLSKKENRENNIKRFNNKIEKCVFLTKNIKDTDTTYNKIRHRKPYIIGYKLPEENEEDTVLHPDY